MSMSQKQTNSLLLVPIMSSDANEVFGLNEASEII